jgi:hypothetical protein
LPSPQEFQNLISEVEVQLFAGLSAPDNNLIQLAWFLHSVASANPGLELYSQERQSAAFRVAGHVFDVGLRSRELDSINKLRLVFAGQTAYFRSDQNPNSIALGRATDLPDVDLVNSPGRSSLTMAICLMMFDRHRVFRLTAEAQRQARTLAELFGVDSLSNTIYGPASHVASACREIMKYLTYPDAADSLRRAASLLRATLAEAQPLVEIDSQWVAAQLLPLTEALGQSSVWAAMPPGSSPAAPRAMTTSPPPVLNLWPPQRKLFTEQRHPLDPGTRRLLLSLPTSAGKSLISQLIVLSHLADQGTGVCLVAPTQSLVREIRGSLRSRLAALPFEMGLETGTWEGSAPSRDVEVMTPERLTHLVRTDLDEVLERFGLFIIDEAHLVDDRERGWGLESTLTLLNSATLETRHRIVLLSSAVGNRAEVMSWIDPQDVGLHFHDEWRGPRRLHGVYTTDVDWDARDETPPAGRRMGRARYPLYGTIRLKTSQGRIASGRFTEPIGIATRFIEGDGQERRGLHSQESSTQRELVVPLVLHLAQGGPTLVIESTKRRAADLAMELASSVEDEEPGLALLAEECSNRLVDGHPLIPALRKGIAFHHAALPIDVQGMIEDAVRGGEIRMLVTTTTLTEGVNLPFRSVVLASQGGEWDGDPYIVGAKLYNAIGRAGRAAKETSGWVVLVKHESFNASMFDLLERRDEDLQITSALTKEAVLELLAAIDEGIDRGDDVIFEIANSVAADFTTYIWHLSRIVEDHDHEVRWEQVQAIVQQTLAWSQLDATSRDSWRRLGRETFDRYQATPRELRRKWATATVSLGSARRLEILANRIADWVVDQSADLELEKPLNALDALIDSGVMERLIELPEAEEVHRKAPRPRPNAPRAQALEIDVPAITRDWVSGVDLNELATRHCGGIPSDSHRAEATVEYTTALFENFLPWTLSHLVPWTNDRLVARGSDVQICPDLGLHIQWGLPNITALTAMRGGVSSRRVVNLLARRAQEEGVDSDDLRQWLGRMGVEELVESFELNRAELGEVLVFARIENRALRSLVAGQDWTIDLPSTDASPGRSLVVLVQDDRGIGFLARDAASSKVLAGIPTPAIEDIKDVLATGLPYQAAVIVEEDSFLETETAVLEVSLLST